MSLAESELRQASLPEQEKTSQQQQKPLVQSSQTSALTYVTFSWMTFAVVLSMFGLIVYSIRKANQPMLTFTDLSDKLLYFTILTVLSLGSAIYPSMVLMRPGGSQVLDYIFLGLSLVLISAAALGFHMRI